MDREGGVAAPRRSAQSVFTGTVLDIGPTLWATSDGKRPTARSPRADDVYREVAVQVTGAGRGASAGRVVTVRVPGGKIGCDQFFVQSVPPLARGDELAILAGGRGGVNGISASDPARVRYAWPVRDNQVLTEDGPVSQQAFLDDNAVVP
jgi:hypothetical protein